VAFVPTSSVPLLTVNPCNGADVSLPVMVSTSLARGVNRGVKILNSHIIHLQ
jgi:hypothetical protein